MANYPFSFGRPLKDGSAIDPTTSSKLAGMYTYAAILVFAVALVAALVTFAVVTAMVMEIRYIESGHDAMSLLRTALVTGAVTAVLPLVSVPMLLWPKCRGWLRRFEASVANDRTSK
jgi:hypothetical protein